MEAVIRSIREKEISEMSSGEKDIALRLQADYDTLVARGYEVLGVFIQGSQNYHLEYDGSDIDTKAIVLPSFHDLIFNNKPANHTLFLTEDGPVREAVAAAPHVDIKDIRLMFDLWKKQNTQFQELLFSRYYITNSKYEDVVNTLMQNRERITHADPLATVSCVVGVMHEKRVALCRPYPAVADKVEAYGYDPKQLHHIIRLKDFLTRFTAGESFESALRANDRDYLIRVKSLPPLYGLDEAIRIADEHITWADNFKKEFKREHPDPQRDDLSELFNTQMETCLRRYYTEELTNPEHNQPEQDMN